MATNNQGPKKTQTEIYRRESRRWPILLILVLGALLFSTAVALGSRWVYREFVKDQPAQSPVPTATDRAPAVPETSGTEESQQSEDTGSEAGQNSNDNLPVTGG